MEEKINQKEEFNHFIERMAKIRELSSPALYDFDDADDYSRRLRKNFESIGRLAAENRKMLDEVLYPILENEELLSDDSVENMSELSEKLMSVAGDDSDFENLDIPIMAMVSERLFRDATERGEFVNLIRQTDAEFIACYSLMNMTERIFVDMSISEKYLKKGLELGQFFINLLKKDVFLTIPDMEMRQLVLTNARFVSAFYEHVTDPELNRKNLELLDQMMKVQKDPFYANAVEDFDWRYFKFRVLQYYLQCTDNGNFRGFDAKQLERINEAADEMEHFFEENSEYVDGIIGGSCTPLLIARNRYYGGRLDEFSYRKVLREYYEKRDTTNFGADGNLANILVPLEYMALLDKKSNAADKMMLKRLYRNMSEYMFRMPSAGALSFLMEYFTGVINRFIEFPSIMTFEEFGLQTLAAIHPPTYIHSIMVGKLTECMCGYLLDMMPEVLVGVADTVSISQVQEKREKILSYAYHAAVCHDFGKIMIIDTILVYGRHLLDSEFELIKTHPMIGAQLLKRHESTRSYADVALGHHRFWDDSRGYPEEFKTADSPVKPIIDLVMCADCMDAATDTVGRSYSNGKTLTQFVEEVRRDAGGRYAPWLLKLLEQDKVQIDLRFLLSEGRESTYHDTYLLLKGVKEKATKTEHS